MTPVHFRFQILPSELNCPFFVYSVNYHKTLTFFLLISYSHHFLTHKLEYINTRQQKKCPVVQIPVSSKVFGRFLPIMYQIEQHTMWVYFMSFYDSIFTIDDSANSWKWTIKKASNKPSKMHFHGCFKYPAIIFTGNWYIWTL